MVPAQPNKNLSPYFSYLYERALHILEKALGPKDPDVATTLENLAMLYRETGREAKAKKLEARAEKIRGIKRDKSIEVNAQHLFAQH